MTTYRFDAGLHEPNDEDRWNPMECISAFGAEWTDRPPQVPESIAQFVRAWNDALDPDCRTRYFSPFIQPLVDGVAADDGTRADLAAEWLHLDYRRAWEEASGVSGMGWAKRDAHAAVWRMQRRMGGDARAAACAYDAVRSAAREAAQRTGFSAAWLAAAGAPIRENVEAAWWLWEQVNWSAVAIILDRERDAFRRVAADDYQTLYVAYSHPARTTIRPVCEQIEASTYRLLQQMVMG